MSDKKDRIVSKVVVKGVIKNISPMIIGTGDKSEEIDILLQRDYKGDPFIPGTTLTGVLRHHFSDYFKNQEFADNFDDYFWGFSKKDGKNNHQGAQSAFIVSDANMISDTYKIETRDGVRINNETGMAKDKGKYDYETLAPGCEFKFNFKLNIREKFINTEFKKILNTLLHELENSNISLGSMTTKGFGEIEIKLDDKDCGIYEFDFSKPKDVINWLKDDFSHNRKDKLAEAVFKKIDKDFEMTSFFKLKTSLLIRSYASDANSPDASHIESNGEKIIPGTSLNGAIRARAERIINTLKIEEQFIKDLMGFADDENKSDVKIKSRVIIKEHRIAEKDVFSLIQNRIKIDRFTGGTVKTALFDLMPVWPKTDEDVLVLKLKIKNCKESEAGLLMLVLKDLWVGDLPIGGEKNVGRGVFSGHKADIKYNGKNYSLEQKDGILKIEGKEEMENWVEQLLEEAKK